MREFGFLFFICVLKHFNHFTIILLVQYSHLPDSPNRSDALPWSLAFFFPSYHPYVLPWNAVCHITGSKYFQGIRLCHVTEPINIKLYDLTDPMLLDAVLGLFHVTETMHYSGIPLILNLLGQFLAQQVLPFSLCPMHFYGILPFLMSLPPWISSESHIPITLTPCTSLGLLPFLRGLVITNSILEHM